MKRYRNIFHRPVEGLEPGAEGELELSQQAERDYVERGFLEILPSEYEVVGPRVVFGNKPGDKFSMSLTAGQEFLLTQAGHIERVEIKPKSARKSRADKG